MKIFGFNSDGRWFWLLMVCVGFIAGCLVLWVVFGYWTIFLDQGAHTDLKNFAEILGGMVLAAGVAVALWRTNIADQQAKTAAEQARTAVEQAETAANQFDLAEQGQITDRFNRAIEQLGKEEAAIRLGGIYSLERVASDSEKDRRHIVEVLCSFIRDQMSETPKGNRLPTYIQTAMSVLTDASRGNSLQGEHQYNLRGVWLVNAELSGAYLRGADLANADLSAVDLSEANLENAELAHVSFVGANLVKGRMANAKLRRADLRGATLSGADLQDAELHYAKLDGANLTGARLRDADFFKAELKDVDFSGANLQEAYLSGADLSGARFVDTKLHGAVLDGVDGLEVHQIREADGDETTVLPAGISPPDKWNVPQGVHGA